MAGAALAALAAADGITAASASGSTPTTAASATNTASAAVRTASVTVAGKTETILVNSQGLPPYIYRPDTATRSFVTGERARPQGHR